MTNQEILDNAPQGATHVDGNYYFKWVKGKGWLLYLSSARWHEGVPPTDKARSLSDIKASVEKDKRIAELQDEIEILKAANSLQKAGLNTIWNEKESTQ